MFYDVTLNILDRPKLADIVEAKFVRNSRSMFIKTDHMASESSEFDFLFANFELRLPQDLMRPAPRGIPISKKNDIIKKLCPLMPATRKVFWNNIDNNEQSADLLVDFE